MLLLLLVIKGNTDQLVGSSGNLGQKRREGNHRIFVEMALFYVFNEEERRRRVSDRVGSSWNLFLLNIELLDM